ncbi:hypothetical protein FD755_022887 [Muntiacus reevesi]|uniref:LIM interaction domain-containing protein n=1 Tax=Muntiacus reevesi TaxID=9886 RepID=A0A5N3VYL4_MUNRE|nr:hypothetical protein FD755_022887 [Muntiacus reevesi]
MLFFQNIPPSRSPPEFKSLDSQESSTSQFKTISSSVLSFLYSPTLTCIHDYWKNYSFLIPLYFLLSGYGPCSHKESNTTGQTWHACTGALPVFVLLLLQHTVLMIFQLRRNSEKSRAMLTGFTFLCVILEPMQELMSRHKTYNLSPRDCLKTCLFQKWQRMVAPPAEPARQPTTKRRKRKNSTSSTSNSSAGNAANSAGSKKKTAAASLSLTSQVPDVMVVGEPTLMGGEFGDEDERLITRLENTQYDAANGMDDEEDFTNSPALGNSSPWNSKPPATQETKSENPPPQASQ